MPVAHHPDRPNAGCTHDQIGQLGPYVESGHETALALGEKGALASQRWADTGHVQAAVGRAGEECQVAQSAKAKTWFCIGGSFEVRPRKQPTR